MKLGLSLVDDAYYIKPKFHFNKKAAHAFASRFYLIKENGTGWSHILIMYLVSIQSLS